MHMRIDKEAEMPQKNNLEATSQEMTIRNKYLFDMSDFLSKFVLLFA